MQGLLVELSVHHVYSSPCCLQTLKICTSTTLHFSTVTTRYIYNKKNRWKRRILLIWLLSIKGRTCHQTPLVHQDMIKKTVFYGKKGEIIQVKCTIGLWFLSSALPLINIYVSVLVFCTFFHLHLCMCICLLYFLSLTSMYVFLSSVLSFINIYVCVHVFCTFFH